MRINSYFILFNLIALMSLLGCNTSQPLAKKEAKQKELSFGVDNEAFTTIRTENIVRLNQAIATKEIDVTEEMVKEYVQEFEGEGFGKYEIAERKLGRHQKEVIFVQEGLPDDSIRGRKVIMTMKMNQKKWEVTNIKENFKCAQNRGHQDWGTEPCL